MTNKESFLNISPVPYRGEKTVTLPNQQQITEIDKKWEELQQRYITYINRKQQETCKTLLASKGIDIKFNPEPNISRAFHAFEMLNHIILKSEKISFPLANEVQNEIVEILRFSSGETRLPDASTRGINRIITHELANQWIALEKSYGLDPATDLQNITRFERRKVYDLREKILRDPKAPF